jgi:hypothetical protein
MEDQVCRITLLSPPASFQKILAASMMCLGFWRYASGMPIDAPRGVLCFSMLSYDVLCFPMVFFTFQWFCILSYAFLCYSILSYDLWCFPMFFYSYIWFCMLSYVFMCSFDPFLWFPVLSYAFRYFPMIMYAFLCFYILVLS